MELQNNSIKGRKKERERERERKREREREREIVTEKLYYSN